MVRQEGSTVLPASLAAIPAAAEKKMHSVKCEAGSGNLTHVFRLGASPQNATDDREHSDTRTDPILIDSFKLSR